MNSTTLKLRRTGKTLILCTLLCAGMLNGMGSQKEYWSLLPKDMQVVILQAFNTYDNADDIIEAIKSARLINTQLREILREEYGNQTKFKALVHILANKTGASTQSIAKKLETIALAAKHYIFAGDTLIKAVKSGDIDFIVAVIGLGADVNYSIDHAGEKLTPLLLAVMREKADVVALLLKFGADPNLIIGYDFLTGRGLKAFDYLNTKQGNSEQKAKIKALLEDKKKE